MIQNKNREEHGERAGPITISMRPGLLQAIDGARGSQSRSDYVRHAVSKALQDGA